MAKPKKSYTPEFKQQIVNLYNTGGTSYPQLEREISKKSSGGGTGWTLIGSGKKETTRQDAPPFFWNGAQMNCIFPINPLMT